MPFSFGDESTNAGDLVSVQCTVTKGDSPIAISWLFNGSEIESTDEISISKNSKKISALTIESVQASQMGEYTCIAKNAAGSSNYTTHLHINVLPQITPISFGDEITNAGDLTSATCSVVKGDTPITIDWYFNGTEIPAENDITISKVGKKISMLSIESARAQHVGEYTCVAKNEAGASNVSTYLYINGYNHRLILPQIVPFSAGEDPINAGDAVSLTCSIVKGDSPMSIYWLFNDTEIESNDEITISKISKKVSALTIESAKAQLMGAYTCVAKNAAGASNYTTYLHVNVPPRWILEPTDKAFAQASNAKVECKADGFPKPQVTWKKAAGVVPGDYKDFKANDPNVKVEDGTLSISDIQKANEGYYLCEATNGIGSGLSAVMLISVQAPPSFEVKLRNQTSRRREPTVLQCEAKGEKPIGILWNMNNKRLDPKSDSRYTIREEILPNGVLSDLSIKRTERSDSALFTCVATNAFGSDDSSINLIVQEIPEAPYDLKVLDKSGRSVQLSWEPPYDGNSPIKKYSLEYKVSKGTWESDIDRVMVPGESTVAGIFNLRPATTYSIRIVAENEMGSSEPSDTVTIITAEEAPSGPPTDVKVEPVDQKTLKISWKPPERDEWNGDILGYYVGYKLSSSDKPYLFETVEFSKEEGKEHHLQIAELKTYTQYSVIVQAFNKVGAGPMSEETRQYTAEGVPEQSPQDTACTTLTSQTIRVSWVSPSLTSANGILKGYKVIYGPSDTWYDENTKDTKITSSSETILHGLHKYTNYSMMVLAFTSGGDGVKSIPIHCQTEQDAPEPPSALKALVMSESSILVSWKPPEQPNGIVTQYTVYFREETPVEGEARENVPKSEKVPPFQMSYEASGLKKKTNYEFWVTASTNIGEGQQSKSVILAPSTRVPAKIASFDDTFTATYKEDVKLPCLAVGMPAPDMQWKVKGTLFQQNDRMRQLPEGSLQIKGVTRGDAGEYSCYVENSFGHDTVTHQLVVHAPPHSPQVTLTSTTTSSITMKLKPHATDTAPLHGYTIHYKPEFGEWETVQVGSQTTKYTLENLWCGTRYQIYVTAYNGIGTGERSDYLNTRTKGSKPVIPEATRFIEVSTNSITLHLSAWLDGGCPMLYFVVEHKKRHQQEWTQVSNNVKPGGNFVVLDLDPASWYHLRVTAHNNAGFAVAEFEFATLTITGATIAPQPELKRRLFPLEIPEWLDLNVVVPLAATVVVILVGIIVICVAVSRRSRGPENLRLRDDVVYNQGAGPNSTMRKQHPQGGFTDELGYIAPPNRKLPPVPGSNYNTCDRIKRGTMRNSNATWDPRRHMYEELSMNPHQARRMMPGQQPGSDENVHQRGMEDEICPYATFHLLGFREEMDPNKAMNFQTFPHQNGHGGHAHSRNSSQSMPRANGRYSRVNGPNSAFSPEYDDPANCEPEEDQYGSQYGPYGAPYDHYGSRNSVSRRSVGSARNLPMNGSPEPPPPPPRNHDNSFNDSKDSNEISEAECDRDQLVNRNYGVKGNSREGMSTEEMRKLIERNEAGGFQQQQHNGGNLGLSTTYDTVAV